MYEHKLSKRNKDQQRKTMNQNTMPFSDMLKQRVDLSQKQAKMTCHQCSKCLQIFIETLPVIFKANLSQYLENPPPL